MRLQVFYQIRPEISKALGPRWGPGGPGWTIFAQAALFLCQARAVHYTVKRCVSKTVSGPEGEESNFPNITLKPIMKSEKRWDIFGDSVG
jgi:hypothetical protein